MRGIKGSDLAKKIGHGVLLSDAIDNCISQLGVNSVAQDQFILKEDTTQNVVYSLSSLTGSFGTEDGSDGSIRANFNGTEIPMTGGYFAGGHFSFSDDDGNYTFSGTVSAITGGHSFDGVFESNAGYVSTKRTTGEFNVVGAITSCDDLGNMEFTYTSKYTVVIYFSNTQQVASENDFVLVNAIRSLHTCIESMVKK